MMRGLALFCTLATLAFSRVTLPDSEILDHNDLNGQPQAPFKCAQGCYFYAASASQILDVYVAENKPGENERALFMIRTHEDDENGMRRVTRLEPSNYYSLKNNNPGNTEPFVFYVVRDTNPGASDVVEIRAEKAPPKTYFHRWVTFITVLDQYTIKALGFAPGKSTSIITAGFDAFSVCNPIFQSADQTATQRSQFRISSAVASVDFGDQHSYNQLLVSTDDPQKNTLVQDGSIVLTSPGFTSCPNINTQYSSNVNTLKQSYSFSKPLNVSFNAEMNKEKLVVSTDLGPFNLTESLIHVESLTKTVNLDWQRAFAGGSFKLTIFSAEESSAVVASTSLFLLALFQLFRL